jgi:carbohydrate diacid regulator
MRIMKTPIQEHVPITSQTRMTPGSVHISANTRGAREFPAPRNEDIDCAAAVINAPKISLRLRKYVYALAGEPSDLIDHCFAEVRRVDEYAGLGPSEEKDVRNAIGLFVEHWCSSMLEQAWFAPEEMESFDAWIRRRVHHGLSLASILCALRRAIEQLWLAHLSLAKHDDELRDELLFVISPHLLKFADFMNQFIGSVFIDEQFRHSRWRNDARRKLCELVFSGTSDEEVFCRIGRNLGFDPTIPRTALAMDCEVSDGAKMNRESPLENFIYRFARHINVPVDHVIYAMRRGRLLIWVPCARGSSLILNQRLLSDAVVGFARKSDEVHAIGVGLLNQRARGWATSAEEAMTALDFSRNHEGGKKVHLYSDIVIYESIRSNSSALRFFESMLGEILHEKDLLKTLSCYFDNNQHRKATAASLDIHPNTLNYRLGRIETLLGVELDSPSSIAPLFVALKMRNVIKVYLGSDAEILTSGTGVVPGTAWS